MPTRTAAAAGSAGCGSADAAKIPSQSFPAGWGTGPGADGAHWRDALASLRADTSKGRPSKSELSDGDEENGPSLFYRRRERKSRWGAGSEGLRIEAGVSVEYASRRRWPSTVAASCRRTAPTNDWADDGPGHHRPTPVEKAAGSRCFLSGTISLHRIHSSKISPSQCHNGPACAPFNGLADPRQITVTRRLFEGVNFE